MTFLWILICCSSMESNVSILLLKPKNNQMCQFSTQLFSFTFQICLNQFQLAKMCKIHGSFHHEVIQCVDYGLQNILMNRVICKLVKITNICESATYPLY